MDSHCPGEFASRICWLAQTRPDYHQYLGSPSSIGLTDLLQKVAGCPNRGSILVHSLQFECGCLELTECCKGRGQVPGRVTLNDCIVCVRGAE